MGLCSPRWCCCCCCWLVEKGWDDKLGDSGSSRGPVDMRNCLRCWGEVAADDADIIVVRGEVGPLESEATDER